MKYSLNWLKELVGFSWPEEILSEKLAELGFTVAGVERTGVSIPQVVSAKILSVEKHPNADRLSVTQVDDGASVQTVVCGATNIAPGQVVPLAKPGAKMPGGLVISVAKIRGVESHGMLCSERELGLSERHEGIFQLPIEAKLGLQLSDILGSDVILDIEIPPNRPDVLSHIGLSRELAVLSGKKLKLQPLKWKSGVGGVPCKIEIREPKLCGRYLGKIISGVKVGPSPQWMVDRLENCGIRPINNIVDITNYVLLEWGHPLHAFDLAKLKGQQIIVRRAKQGEKIEALDGKIYELSNDDLAIADADSPIAIAGVMGGQVTGVDHQTTDILLESAVFNPQTIRATSKRLGLKSESSIRFEKGTDVQTALMASMRAAQLILELAGGVAGKSSDAYPKKQVARKISLTQNKLFNLLGVTLKKELVERILTNLEYKVTSRKDTWICQVPLHRKDLLEDADVIEDVLRFYGYTRIPTQIGSFRVEAVTGEDRYENYQTVANVLKGWGINEVLSTSLSSVESNKNLGISEDRLVKLANPLSQEETALRPLLIPNLLSAVKKNIYAQRDDVALFEIGSRHWFDKSLQRPQEEICLAIALYGNERVKSWSAAPREVDFFTAKGLVQQLSEVLGLGLVLRQQTSPPYLHPQMSFEISDPYVSLGFGGIVHPEVALQYDLKKPCIIIEMKMISKNNSELKFANFSRFPFVERDIAVVLNSDTQWSLIEELVRATSGSLLHSIYPFDIFTGGQLGEGKKSLAFRCRFQLKDRTLTDAEISTTIERIKSSLVERCGAQLR